MNEFTGDRTNTLLGFSYLGENALFALFNALYLRDGGYRRLGMPYSRVIPHHSKLITAGCGATAVYTLYLHTFFSFRLQMGLESSVACFYVYLSTVHEIINNL